MTPDQFLAIGAVFVATAVVTLLVAQALLGRRAPAQERLDKLVEAGPAPVVRAETILAHQPDATLQQFSRFIPKSPADMTRLQRRLARAGYHSSAAAILYSVSEILLPLGLAALPVLWLGLYRGGIVGIILAIIGYLVPGFVLSWKIEDRKKRISNGLADALDLLIVCVEAGLGLDQAIQKASDELQITYPALAEELRMVTTEMRAGKPRLEAFRNFADRTKADDVKSLVAMLTQTDRFGTSIAQALRTFAETMRTKRRQRAEERAAKLGVKLVFPLVFCLFPALYVVTLGPAVIQFVRVFFGQVVQR